MELWSPQHIRTLLPSLIAMIAVGALLRLLLIKKSERIRFIPFQIVAVFIFVIEVIKQIKEFTSPTGYDLYSIPLHFCSFFIYMLPIMAFYTGKYKARVRGITTALCGSLFLLMTIYPNIIYSGQAIEGSLKNFWDFHTTFFHVFATFEFVLIVALDLHKPEPKKDALTVLIFIACYCVVAGIMAQVIDTNFNNFRSCNVAPLENVRISAIAKMGNGLGQTFYVVIVSIVNLLFVSLAYQFYRLMNFIVKKISKLFQPN